jgi:hypothetical protein
MSSPSFRQRPEPIFGTLSIAAPVAGFLGAWVFIANSDMSEFKGMGILGIAMIIVLLSMLVGGMSCLIAFFRREKYLGLAAIGLLLNLAPIVLYLEEFR